MRLWESTKEFCSKHKLATFASGIAAFFFGSLAIGWCITHDGLIGIFATGESIEITFVQWFEGTVAVTGIIISVAALGSFKDRLENQEEQTKLQTRALENQEKQTASQVRKEVDERFSNAVTLLSSDRASARTGALYALHELAMDKKKYRKQIAKILCGHIRSQTREDGYAEAHPLDPSEDVQTAINLLFKDTKEAQGLYPKFSSDLPQANLAHAYLAGANFSYAKCQNVIFAGVRCRTANFSHALCQKALFWATYCQGVKFTDAHCEGAEFIKAHCQGASFMNAHCQGANFNSARCEAATFMGANCQGANFTNTRCQKARFASTKFQGAFAFTTSDDGFSAFNVRGLLSQRIGQETYLKSLIVSGQLDKDSIDAIESAKAFMPSWWVTDMQNAISKNEGRRITYEEPADIIPGELEDSPELQKIIREIEGDD